MPLFLLLSLLSGVLELGGAFLSAVNGVQGWKLLILPLMYQLGNLLSGIWPIRPRWVGTIGIALALAGVLPTSSALFAFRLMAASFCLQRARCVQKENCPTWLKRSFRIGGFVLSPAMALWPAVILTVCLMIPALTLLTGPAGRKKLHPGVRVVPVMVFHQMHYFIYTYIMPVWLFAQSGSLLLSGAVFGLTWVIYLLPQTVAEKMDSVEPRRMFFACHTFLALTMGALCVSSALGYTPLMCAAWLLSGLGGGSVFCIRELLPAHQRVDLTLSENIGHVAGVLAAIPILAAFPAAAVPALTGASCGLVCLALASAAILIAKEEKHGVQAR